MTDVSLGLAFNLVANIDRYMVGWDCIEPVEAKEGEFEPFLAEFLQAGESCLGGEKMLKRAKEQGICTGLCHAEAMLREQDKIPVDCRKYYLVFPEVWQGPYGCRYVFYLYWDGVYWYLDFSRIDRAFDSAGRLVASRK